MNTQHCFTLNHDALDAYFNETIIYKKENKITTNKT